MNTEKKDMRDWLAVLKGKSVPGADPETVFEAQALRAELEFRHQPPAELNPRILTNVLAQSRAKQPRRWLVGLSLAASLITGIAVDRLIFPPEISPLPRALSPFPAEMKVANPEAAAELFCSQLQQLGIVPERKFERGSWLVTTPPLSPEVVPRVQALLAKEPYRQQNLDRMVVVPNQSLSVIFSSP